MAWPLDDRDHDFTPLARVPSSTLNEMQDRIVDVHRERSRIIASYGCITGATNLPTWYNSPTGLYWQCREAGATFGLVGSLSLPNGAVVTGIDAKIHLQSASGLTIEPFKLTSNMATAKLAAAAVSLGTIQTPTIGSGYPDQTEVTWSDGVNGFSDWQCTTGDLLCVVFLDPDVQDRVEAVQVTYEPLTST